MRAGETLGGYRILSNLGEGGMGAVYLAEHTRIFRKAAIKVLRPELTTNARAVERLFAEARATALMRHPAIVDVLDCDVHESGRAYIAMEYLEGETLATLLARMGSFAGEIDTAVAVVGRIASGLGAAHERGVVHRDVKPENLFLVHRGAEGLAPAVKILDFGIARFVALSPDAHTRSGVLTGTPAYMSPEQCRGVGVVDARSDIYSLGCVLFEMLCGRPPFVCVGPGEFIADHITTRAPRASSFHRELPATLDEVLARTLAKAPHDRPESAEDLISALERSIGVPASRFEELIQRSRLLAAARMTWDPERRRSRGMVAVGGAAGEAPGGRSGPETMEMAVAGATPADAPDGRGVQATHRWWNPRGWLAGGGHVLPRRARMLTVAAVALAAATIFYLQQQTARAREALASPPAPAAPLARSAAPTESVRPRAGSAREQQGSSDRGIPRRPAPTDSARARPASARGAEGERVRRPPSMPRPRPAPLFIMVDD